MQGIQCDNCRKFSGNTADWLIVSHQGSVTGLFGQPIPELNGTFCSTVCLAEWAYVKASLETEPTAVEAKPRVRKKT